MQENNGGASRRWRQKRDRQAAVYLSSGGEEGTSYPGGFSRHLIITLSQAWHTIPEGFSLGVQSNTTAKTPISALDDARMDGLHDLPASIHDRHTDRRQKICVLLFVLICSTILCTVIYMYSSAVWSPY